MADISRGLSRCNRNISFCEWACIRKKFSTGNVLSLKFMCMDAILRNTEKTTEQDIEESRKVCNLDNPLGYQDNSLLDLMVTFNTTRRLGFTPSVYLFLIIFFK